MNYKNILWIEDEDTNEAEIYDPEEELSDNEQESPPSELCRYFFKNPEQVKKVNYFNAISEEIRNFEKYDLIIFDINMNNDSTVIENYEALMKILKKSGITPRHDRNEFLKRAGAYLYFFYLQNEYPASRMAVLTGNTTDYCMLEKEETPYLSEISPLNILVKDKIRGKYDWIDRFYSGQSSYYFVRRLVFQACEYWKDQLKNKKNPEIPFNILYFGDKAEKQGISANEFIEKLENLEIMMPVSRPSDPEKIYYQIIQHLSAFHEGKVDITKINKYPDLKKYHCCMRNFRNWSAHNKLDNRKIKKEYFLIMFCIALRTYFNGEPEQPNFDESLYDYEKICNFNNSEETDFSKIEKTLKECFKETANNLKDYRTNTVEGSPYLDLDKMIREYSKNPKAIMSMKYIFLPIWSDEKLLTAEETDNTEYLPKNQEISVVQTKTVKWSFNNDCFKNLCQKSEENNTDGIFMKYCSRFLK